MDGSGVVQWAKTAGTGGSDVAYSVWQTSDGGYIVSGYTDGVTGVAQFLVSKFDGNGAFQWATSLGNPSDSAVGLSVQQTTDGGYVASGFPGGAIGGLGLLKYDSTGQLQWLRRAVGTNVYGNSVQQTSDGGYIVAGSKQIGTTQYDLTLLKFDGSGNLQWAQLAGGSGNESGNAVQQTSDGGYIVAGATASFGAGGQDVLLLKYDASGTLQWARTAGGSGDDEADSVQQTSDGGYIVSGRTASFGVGENTLLLKYDGSGTLQWARAGGGSTSSATVQQTSDGGYLVAGSTASFGAGGSDILLIRTDANGNVAGCANWASVSPSIGTTFPSAATSYAVDSPSFSISSPILTVATAPLTSNDKCTAVGQPAISVAPTQITFPPTLINTTSSPVQVTISNTGTANLVISDISTQDPFAITNPSSNITGSIAPNTQGTFDAIFRPTTVGPFSGSVTIQSNAPTSPTVIQLSGEAAAPPPAISPPFATRTVVDNIDPNLPTIVLTHGLQKQGANVESLWTGTGFQQASALIRNVLPSSKANVIQYVWTGAFQPFGCVIGLPDAGAYIAAQSNVINAGTKLANELLRILGSNYNKPIHFVGHSLGTAVNTYAAKLLLKSAPQVRFAQFTALDRPHHLFGKICALSQTEEKLYGYDSNFFAANLSPSRSDLTIVIDNYYSTEGAG